MLIYSNPALMTESFVEQAQGQIGQLTTYSKCLLPAIMLKPGRCRHAPILCANNGRLEGQAGSLNYLFLCRFKWREFSCFLVNLLITEARALTVVCATDFANCAPKLFKNETERTMADWIVREAARLAAYRSCSRKALTCVYWMCSITYELLTSRNRL